MNANLSPATMGIYAAKQEAAELDLAAALNALPRPEGVTINRFWVNRNENIDAPRDLRWETRVYFAWTDREVMGRPVNEHFYALAPTSAEADANVLTQIAHWMHL